MNFSFNEYNGSPWEWQSLGVVGRHGIFTSLWFYTSLHLEICNREKWFGDCSSPDNSSPDCSSHYRIKCLV